MCPFHGTMLRGRKPREHRMTEGSNHYLADDSDELEMSAAAAIERLIADRNNLRTPLAAQERELTALHAAQDDVEGQFRLLHKTYIVLAKNVVSQLREFDRTFRVAMTQSADAPNPEIGTRERRFDGEGLPIGAR